MYAFALILAAVPGSPQSEADRLLEETDATIMAARTLRVEFEIARGNARIARASLALGDHNRVNFRFGGDDGTTAIIVSDGKQMVIVSGTPAEKKARAMPDWYGQIVRDWLGRGGTFLTVAKVDSYLDRGVRARPGRTDSPLVSNARLLPDEEVKGVKCRVVEFDLAWEKILGDLNGARVRVWIDAKTKLPVRRSVWFKEGKSEQPIPFIATHNRFELNPKLDDELFALPK